jgi:hypothetical protein
VFASLEANVNGAPIISSSLASKTVALKRMSPPTGMVAEGGVKTILAGRGEGPLFVNESVEGLLVAPSDSKTRGTVPAPFSVDERRT